MKKIEQLTYFELRQAFEIWMKTTIQTHGRIHLINHLKNVIASLEAMKNKQNHIY